MKRGKGERGLRIIGRFFILARRIGRKPAISASIICGRGSTQRAVCIIYTHLYTRRRACVYIYIYIYATVAAKRDKERERARARDCGTTTWRGRASARAATRERERGSKRGALAATLLPPAAAAAAAVLLPPALNYAGLLSTPGGPASRAHLARRSACAVPVCPCSLESLCTYYIRALLSLLCGCVRVSVCACCAAAR